MSGKFISRSAGKVQGRDCHRATFPSFYSPRQYPGLASLLLVGRTQGCVLRSGFHVMEAKWLPQLPACARREGATLVCGYRRQVHLPDQRHRGRRAQWQLIGRPWQCPLGQKSLFSFDTTSVVGPNPLGRGDSVLRGDSSSFLWDSQSVSE